MQQSPLEKWIRYKFIDVKWYENEQSPHSFPREVQEGCKLQNQFFGSRRVIIFGLYNGLQMYVDWTVFPLQLLATCKKMFFEKFAKLEYFYIKENYSNNDNIYL